MTLTPAEAKRERVKLRQKRHTKTVTESCNRCGGAGGWHGWPGFTCFKCGGRCTMEVERRMYEDAALQQRDDELTEIIEEERAAKIRAEFAAKEGERYDRAWDDAHREYEAHLAILAAQAQQRYLGEIDERITVEGVVKVTVVLDGGQWSDKILMVIEDACGNFVKTIGTGATLWKPARGTTVTMVGTVKAHEMYNGDKQTVLYRCKITKWEDNDD